MPFASDDVRAQLFQAGAFEKVVADSRLPMAVTDAKASDAPLIYVNDAFCALTGYDARDVLGRNCRFMQGPETDRADVEAVRAVLASGRPGAVDIRNHRRDGTTFWNALHLSPVRDDAGELAWHFATQVDVSDRKAGEALLGAARDHLEAVVAGRTAELEAALAAKTRLLHELDHRVKNNLQLVASLLMLQMRRTADPAAKAALRTVLDRVGAVSTVHRRMFQGEDLSRFDAIEFLGDLLEERLGRRLAGEAVLPSDTVSLPAQDAAPLALAVGELVTWVAGPEGAAEGVRLGAEREDGHLRVTLTGAGSGLDGDPFGREIAVLLARQLRAKVDFRERDAEQGGGRTAYLLLPV